MSRFQSTTIEDGMFSRTGTCHMHIDAGGSEAAIAIAELVDRLHPVPCKAVPVVALVGGPQRKESPDAYAEHHPAHEKDPQADSFASVYLGDTGKLFLVQGVLNTVYSSYPTAVVELEQVVFSVNWDGFATSVTIEQEHHPLDVDGARQIQTHVSYEYHHGFNLPKAGPQPDLEVLVDRLASRDVPFGSIYVFDRGDQLAYRTNCFIADADPEQLIKEGRICTDVLTSLIGTGAPVKTVLERVLGIWQPAGEADDGIPASD